MAGRDDLVVIRDGVRYLKADEQRVAEGHGEGPHDDRPRNEPHEENLVITTSTAHLPGTVAGEPAAKGGEQRASNKQQGAAGKPE